MAKRKYEHLVKPLSVGGMDMGAMKDLKVPKGAFANGPGNADKIVWLNGKDHLEGLNLNFTWGFYSGIGDWHTGQDPHTHPYPECLVFVGLDSANLNYLGAEIEICLGEEQEAYTFDEPTIVIVPAGMLHCPLTTKRVWSPKGFGFYLASLGAVPTTTWMGEGVSEEAMKAMQEAAAKSGRKIGMTSYVSEKRIKKNPTKPTGKYAHLVKPLRTGMITQRGKPVLDRLTAKQRKQFDAMAKQGQKLGPGNADHLAWFYSKDLEGLEMNLTWGFYSKPGIWHRGVGAHVHPTDEVLVFAGLDPTDINYLGAKIEIDLGEEHERYIFDQPTVVICPKGLPHNPVVVRWVDRPYAFYLINLGGEHNTTAFD
jgi:hypothetical protein